MIIIIIIIIITRPGTHNQANSCVQQIIICIPPRFYKYFQKIVSFLFLAS